MGENPYIRKFMENPTIQRIAGNKRWTISDKNKMPIDMYMLMYRDTINGAAFNNELSLVSLDELYRFIPNMANFAYYLSALTDRIVVMDIEPKCPDEIKEKFTKLPALYAETSMSGRGIHLVFPLKEELILKYPAISTKTAIKEEHGWYEILLEHYVTFTGKQLPHTPLDMSNPDATKEFDTVFVNLAKNIREYVRSDTDIEELKDVETTYTDQILESLLWYSRQNYKKTPEDFFGDMSRYEFSYLSWLFTRAKDILNITKIKKDHKYSDSEIAWLMYKTAQEFLPYREKHDEERNGLPWLLFEIQEVMSKTEKPKAKQKNTKDKHKKGDNA